MPLEQNSPTSGFSLEQFLRLHGIRAPGIAWFLGAGASAAAGVPTARDMIWEFKRLLYCTAERVPFASCADLGDPVLRNRLQRHFDSRIGLPTRDDPSEYADYFERAYPDEIDRRRYIERQATQGLPSFGHFALAGLMRMQKVRVVWTTNFDTMIEDAVAKVFGTTARLVVASLDAPGIALEALNENRFPVLAKLHGDFRSRRLKNSGEELRRQDTTLRTALVETCQRFGLAVVGYSGRDTSVMESLREAINRGKGFPAGLYWFHRSDGPPLDPVMKLFEDARSAGVRAEVIPCDTFDELMADLLLLEENLPREISVLLEQERGRDVSDAPVPAPGRRWPVIRLNALPVTGWPMSCRLIECDIGGTADVRKAVEAAGVDVIVGRRSTGVIAFGSDETLRSAFDRFGIRRFDLHSVEAGRLEWESAELGLFYEALARSFARELPLNAQRQRQSHLLVVDGQQEGERCFEALRSQVGAITGIVPSSNRRWAEAVELRMDFRLKQLWLLLDPTVWVERPPGTRLDDESKELIRGRLASRYNRDRNALLDIWCDILLDGEKQREVRALGISDGVDAVFTIGSITAFSRRSPST